MARNRIKSEIKCALEMAQSGVLYPAPLDVMVELCRTWLAVQAEPVTPVSEMIEPPRKPLGEIGWPDFQTSYIKAMRCDETGRLLAHSAEAGELR